MNDIRQKSTDATHFGHAKSKLELSLVTLRQHVFP